jgi:diaminohydroxyphosphoribosylaminopyrimidine deaminase/5-amino-6-(5-phosphoribosylamino)uracil reductase
MVTDDIWFLQRCLDLASMAGKRVKRNPQVGAVLVHNHTIIGEGFHAVYGEAHAEIKALENVPVHLRHLIPQSKLYVSLEPCCHYGKTPPCCERIWLEGIRHVVVGCQDPNPMVAGKGIDYLRSRNIRVDLGKLTSASENQISRFTANVHGLPYIVLKWAQSNDLYISETGKQTWLSHPYTSVLTHKWRSSCDAILIGSKTAIIDNPDLTVRNYYGDNPIRIILSNHPDTLTDLNFWKDEEKTWILNEQSSKKINNKRLIRVPDISNLNQILTLLYAEGVNSILVEGGHSIFRSFITQGLWNEARVIRTKKMIGPDGIPAPVVQGKLLKKEKVMDDEILWIANQ